MSIHNNLITLGALTASIGLYLLFLLKFVWDRELRHEFCSFSKSVFSDAQCIYFSNDATFFTLFVSLAFVTLFLSTIVTIRSGLFSRSQKITLLLIVLLQIVLASGSSRYCLGLLGCSTVEHWPYVLPFTISFIFCLIVITAFRKRYNFIVTLGALLTVSLTFSLLINGVITKTLTKIDYSFLRETYVEKFQLISASDNDYLFTPVRQLGPSAPTNRTAFQPALVLPAEYVEAAIYHEEKLLAPTHLYPLEGLQASYRSNNSIYYIREGNIFIHQSNAVPASIYINGIKPGIIDIPIQYNNQLLFEIADIPITSNTRLSFDINIEDTGHVRWDKVSYDIDGDSVVEMDLSWKEPVSSNEIWDTFIRTIIIESDVSAQDKLQALNLLPLDWSSFEDVGEFYTSIKLINSIDWSDILEVVALRLISLQNT